MIPPIEIPQIELELVLIRHGLTKWNAEHRYLGHTDLPILPSALDELSALKEQLQLTGEFWRVFCSDLLRCRETLAYIAPSLEQSTIYDNRLREMNFGDWEGCTYEQLKDNEQYRSWIDSPAAVTPPGGESWRQFEARLGSFLSDLGQAAENGRYASAAKLPFRRALIVTHGGVIRGLLAQTLPAVTFHNTAAPAHGTVIVIRMIWQNGQWSAASSIST
ncbi:histidine phosphatase family protein [Paenibacillus monticola]|nr:histidine phosphatase family protein [Paenibacillus monticola]